MRIKSLRKYDGRNPNGYFNDLPLDVRKAAWRWLSNLGGRNLHPNVPLWRWAILIGQAKRLALVSDGERSAWGRSMLAKRGGYALEWTYRFEGRSPTAAATQVGASTPRTENKLQESPR